MDGWDNRAHLSLFCTGLIGIGLYFYTLILIDIGQFVKGLH